MQYCLYHDSVQKCYYTLWKWQYNLQKLTSIILAVNLYYSYNFILLLILK